MKMFWPIMASCTALLLSGAPAITAPQGPSRPPAPSATSELDADAVQALNKMGEALRSHGVFAVTMDVSSEDVLQSGQKLQYVGTVEIRARRPDRFKWSIASDIKNRDIYYDGKSVTVFAPRLGVYTTFAAPGTIAETLAQARDRFGVDLPLADLFTWGTDDAQLARLTSGFLVRPEHIDGRACNHYAFRQQNVDWQIWIAGDQSSLPCKLVITKTDDPSRPQYSAVLHWTFPNTFADSNFAFAPPPGSQKIAIIAVGTAEKGATP